MSDREWARARVAARSFLRDNYPDAQWDAIDDLSRALTHELYVGPMPYNYWNDKANGDALCVQWFSWPKACKHLSAIIDAELPSQLWYDIESGIVSEELPYIESDDEAWMDVPTIEALFDKELWRYLT